MRLNYFYPEAGGIQFVFLRQVRQGVPIGVVYFAGMAASERAVTCIWIESGRGRLGVSAGAFPFGGWKGGTI